jgi:hypothetical protein
VELSQSVMGAVLFGVGLPTDLRQRSGMLFLVGPGCCGMCAGLDKPPAISGDGGVWWDVGKAAGGVCLTLAGGFAVSDSAYGAAFQKSCPQPISIPDKPGLGIHHYFKI